MERRLIEEAGLDVNIGIVIGYQNNKYLLYRGAIKNVNGFAEISLPFTDSQGYDTPEEVLESAIEQFEDFGGRRFVRILLLENVEKEIAENLEKIANKKEFLINPERASIKK